LTTLFNINFRREAYRKELARTRRRVLTLAAWVGYFGVVIVVIGLYGLNCAVLGRRVNQIEQQTVRFQATQSAREQWQLPAAEIARIQDLLSNPVRWRDRLARLAELLPENVRLTSVAANPNTPGAQGGDHLLIMGQMRIKRGEDRMTGVMRLVTTLREDSLFGARFGNVKLSSTKILAIGTGMTEFVIECQ
jgi:Tfp pilus assembly protein PilN